MANIKKGFVDWFLGRLPEGEVSVGGQAVMEGVMMQGPKHTAIAVRKSDGSIVYSVKKTVKLSEKYPFLGWPILRGIVSFVMSLVGGMKTLMESAEMAGLDYEEPSAFEKKVAGWLHVKPDDVMIYSAVVLAIVLAVGLFFGIPTAIESLLKRVLASEVLINLIGGLVRIGMFLVYVFLCSKLKEIRRVFQYHGAEHKSIFCFEHKEDLTVENARKYTTLHPRCGTSFLVIVMVISMLIFLLMGNKSGNVLARLGSRLLLLPLVAGVSFEILKGLAYAGNNPLVRALKWPGLMVQKITTAEPDDEMLEVALVSMKAALGYENPLPPQVEEPAEPQEPTEEQDASEEPAEDDRA